MEKDFIVECAVCKHHLTNWVGSTPCCGSIAYVVDEDNNPTNSFMVYAKVEDKNEISKI